MKENIHPKYLECKVTCGCGNSFMTRSTKSELHVEICHMCHPFYSGKQKFVDTAGRVEKFQKRHAWDNSTMGKVLEKEPTKKLPKKLEKVTVGLPKMRKRKPEEEEALEEAATPATGKGGRGPGGRGAPRGEKREAAPPAEGAPKETAAKAKPAKAAAPEAASQESKA